MPNAANWGFSYYWACILIMLVYIPGTCRDQGGMTGLPGHLCCASRDPGAATPHSHACHLLLITAQACLSCTAICWPTDARPWEVVPRRPRPRERHALALLEGGRRREVSVAGTPRMRMALSPGCAQYRRCCVPRMTRRGKSSRKRPAEGNTDGVSVGRRACRGRESDAHAASVDSASSAVRPSSRQQPVSLEITHGFTSYCVSSILGDCFHSIDHRRADRLSAAVSLAPKSPSRLAVAPWPAASARCPLPGASLEPLKGRTAAAAAVPCRASFAVPASAGAPPTGSACCITPAAAGGGCCLCWTVLTAACTAALTAACRVATVAASLAST